MLLKDDIKIGIEILSKEPDSIERILSKLYDAIEAKDKIKILKIINELDVYAGIFLNKEEYYAELTDFPRLKLFKKDINYYKATYYRLRYHFLYYDLNTGEYEQIYIFALHLAENLKTWLDFHKNTFDNELIDHMKKTLKEEED